MRDLWWLSLPTLPATAWAMWEISRLSRIGFHAWPARRRRAFMAMGTFQISVGLTLFSLAANGDGLWVNGVAVTLMGAMFFVAARNDWLGQTPGGTDG